MSYRTVLIVIIATVSLAACKIEITVPTGGSVTTDSGNYTCAEGKTCTIDVVDLFFDENFVATPKSGYEFVQWKKKRGGFCGAGKTRFESCHLYTSLFKDIPELAQFLERDDVFFLEPVFTAVGGGSGGSGGGGGGGSGGNGSGNGSGSGNGGSGGADQTAGVCFQAKIFNKGYRTNLKYRIVDEGSTYQATEDSVTNGKGMSSGGRSGTKITSTTKATVDGQQVTGRREAFVKVDIARKRSTTFAIETELLTPQSGEITVIHNPGILTRFDLKKGQRFSQSYSTEITTEFGGNVVNRQSTQSDITTTYRGVAKVTVPAGTFQACKFSEEGTTDVGFGPMGSSSNVWYAVGSGVLLKSNNSDGGSTVLLSGSINGSPMK